MSEEIPELYLVRHGIAEDHAASGRDADRALTRSGREKMAKAARGLEALEVAPSVILTSPLVRTRETAEIIADQLGRIAIEDCDAIAPGVDHAAVARLVAKRLREGSVMLVGHEPDMSELFSFLLTGERSLQSHFKKGTVACLSAGELPPHGLAALEWLMHSSQLAALR
ncbi:MAG TPA: phosphohistidine phosphatase SixA [Candidatus Bathyarchaeia archaeon]|nr:phosphohistidine phosphatase SixA [Candidatus Bathyarchaeia archaeon]